MENKYISIAIDGPSAAGKSTIAKAMAKALDFIYVDTGSLYRAIGCYALEHGADTTNPNEITPLLSGIDIQLIYENKVARVMLNNEDVSEKIRLPQMAMAASNVSALPPVRAFLLKLQQDIAKKNNVVMDGRDIATVVLPNADIKFFLTASPKERTKRRLLEFNAKGIEMDFDDLLKETIQRDYNDSHREIAPLKPAKESVVVDSTHLSLESATTYMLNVVKERLEQ